MDITGRHSAFNKFFCGESGKRAALLIVLLFSVFLADGCSENESVPRMVTEIEELNDLCFHSSTDCEELQVDLVLYLDTVNLPSNNGDIRKLVLSSKPTYPIADGNDRIEYFFDGSGLPEEIDPGILDEIGWKVGISSAEIVYCNSCFTNFRLAEVIWLSGSVDDIEFIYDPNDNIDIFITTRPKTEALYN